MKYERHTWKARYKQSKITVTKLKTVLQDERHLPNYEM
jgi:hypothetical protein